MQPKGISPEFNRMCTLSRVVVLQFSNIVCTWRDFRQSSHVSFEAASVSAVERLFAWMNLHVPLGITSCSAGVAALQVWTFPQSVSGCASCVSQLLCKSRYIVCIWKVFSPECFLKVFSRLLTLVQEYWVAALVAIVWLFSSCKASFRSIAMLTFCIYKPN